LKNLVSAEKTMQSADMPPIHFQRCRQPGTASIWSRILALLHQASSDKSLACMAHCHIQNYILKSIRITENISTPHFDFHDGN